MVTNYLTHIKRILERFNPDKIKTDYSTEDGCEFIYFEKGDMKIFFNYFDDDIKANNDNIIANISYKNNFKSYEGTYTTVISKVEKELNKNGL